MNPPANHVPHITYYDILKTIELTVDDYKGRWHTRTTNSGHFGGVYYIDGYGFNSANSKAYKYVVEMLEKYNIGFDIIPQKITHPNGRKYTQFDIIIMFDDNKLFDVIPDDIPDAIQMV
jgi:hypothetical protein